MIDTTKAAVSGRLRTALGDERGLKAKIATACGVSAQAVTGWLNGGGFDFAHMPTISDLTGYNLRWLMTGEGQPKGDDDVRDIIGEFRNASPEAREAAFALFRGMKSKK